MDVIGSFILFFGVCFIFTAALVLLMNWSDRRLLGELRRASQLTLGELAAARLPRVVLITGRTAAGPEGLLISPAFGTRCVTYRTVVNNAGSSSGPASVNLSGGGDHLTVTDGTGSAQVQLRLVRRVRSGGGLETIRHDSQWIKRGETVPGADGLARLQQHGLLKDSTYPRLIGAEVELAEHTIAPEVEVSVLARPRREPSGALVLRGRGAINPGPAPDWIAQLEKDIATSRVLILSFALIGIALGAVGLGILLATG